MKDSVSLAVEISKAHLSNDLINSLFGHVPRFGGEAPLFLQLLILLLQLVQVEAEALLETFLVLAGGWHIVFDLLLPHLERVPILALDVPLVVLLPVEVGAANKLTSHGKIDMAVWAL